MAKKITKELFIERFKNLFPEAKIEILEYTTISKPCTIKCLKCGTVKKYSKASNVLKFSFCCENINREELAKKELKKFNDFHFIKRDKQDFIVMHNKCNKTFRRNISSIIKSAGHCPYCDENKGLALTIDKAQEQIDKEFFNTIKLLEYNAVRTKNTYKCLKCGLIFKQTQKNLLASRGCPKCDRFKSKGETAISRLLEGNNVIFNTQVSFKDLSDGKQRFDFVVYKDNELSEVLYCIECQGEQHRIAKEGFFKDSLEKIQERDQRKRDYCKKKGYPFYEIIYQDGKLLNLDILPFIKKD
ncbi:MAG: hypothetical protein [Caudoviricetes sp.]|nr:MAG: hypothetical protein [Caudoviricetes sp.]